MNSWVATSRMRGTFTCLRSVTARPNAPVVNRHDNPARLPLIRGKRSVGPLRLPVRESDQFPKAVARYARPEEYASFEFSLHQGATSYLAVFQSLRRV